MEGMADIKNKLYASLDIKSRRGRGGMYDYVSSKDVMDRMNDAFGINWTSEVVSQTTMGDNVIVRVRVSVYNSDIKRFMFQEGFGGAKDDPGIEVGNAFKSAYSKALRDACKKWGVGLYLDDDSPSDNSIPTGYSGIETANKQREMPSIPPMEKPTFPVDEPSMRENFPKPESITAPPLKTISDFGGMPMPPGINMTMESSINIKQEKETLEIIPTTRTNTPNVPPPVIKDGSVGSPPPMPPMPSKNTNSFNTIEASEDKISDVQKAALHSILNIKGVEYEALATEAFEKNGIIKNPIPSPDDLTYKEAVCVVKYGNDKFRRR